MDIVSEISLAECDEYSKEMGQIPAEEKATNAFVEEDTKFVYFDIETTGFGKETEICQIAVKHRELEFSEYILPLNYIDYRASMVNRLTLVDGVLHKDNVPVETLSLEECLKKFLDFLGKLGKSVVLVGHNIIRFDCPLLFRDMKQYQLFEKFSDSVVGLLDTFPMMKSVIPGRKSYKLSTLAEEYLTPEECLDAHDALCDVRMLEGVIEKMGVTPNILYEHCITLEIYFFREAKKQEISNNVLTLNPCVGVISNGMIKRLAASGLNLPKLLSLYNDVGKEGVQAIMSEDMNGKPKITKNRRIISSLSTFLANYRG